MSYVLGRADRAEREHHRGREIGVGHNVTVVAPEGARRRALRRILSGQGLRVSFIPSLTELIRSDEGPPTDLIVATGVAEVDPVTMSEALGLPGAPDLILLDGDSPSHAEVGNGGRPSRVRGLAGDLEALGEEVRRALRARSDGVSKPSAEAGAVEPGSRAMEAVLAFASRVATGDASLLLLGETGSGKEWLARRIHAASARANRPFVAVNCAAIPEGLAESELFGHVKGAFTGAVGSRRGHFEMAHQGTLFLDEVGDLPLAVQVRLLRVLQDGTFQPVGSERPIRVDVRTIAATHHALDEAVERGDFRRDLYYRLAVVSMELPPLRERREDVVMLLDSYLAHFAERAKRGVPRFSFEAMATLMGYSWPGNVRELINVVERAVLLGDGDILGVEVLPPGMFHPEAKAVAPGNGSSGRGAALIPFALARAEALEAFERRYVVELLEGVGGRVGEGARRAGMSQRALFNKMRRYGLRKEDFRA